jgi:hypothetical protein
MADTKTDDRVAGKKRKTDTSTAQSFETLLQLAS